MRNASFSFRVLASFLGAAFIAASAVAACGGGSSSGGSSGGGGSGSPNSGGSGSATGASGGATGDDDAGASTGTDASVAMNMPTEAGAVSTQAGSCANPTVPLVFSPMYSAYIPGSTAQTFSLPVVTSDLNPATWSLSDPTQGNLQTESFAIGGVLAPGVLVTLAGTGNASGQVTVIAVESDGTCGTAVLTITQNVEDDWNIGNARYNDGVALHVNGPGGGGMGEGGADRGEAGADRGEAGTDRSEAGAGGDGFDASAFHFEAGAGGFAGLLTDDGGSYYETDGGTACTNCHGPTATSGPYKTVSHTPEQTGGFSDMDLQNIIWNGEIPDGGYFDPTVIDSTCDGGPTCTSQAMAVWHSFHRWTDITADELPGVICYLRSLAPEAQTGQSNFGGATFRTRDGGRP